MSRRNRRDGSAVDRDRRSAGKGAETRINHTTNAIDVDCEEHMLPHAFVAGFEHSKAYKVWAKEVVVDKGQVESLRPNTILRALEESMARCYREGHMWPRLPRQFWVKAG